MGDRTWARARSVSCRSNQGPLSASGRRLPEGGGGGPPPTKKHLARRPLAVGTCIPTTVARGDYSPGRAAARGSRVGPGAAHSRGADGPQMPRLGTVGRTTGPGRKAVHVQQRLEPATWWIGPLESPGSRTETIRWRRFGFRVSHGGHSRLVYTGATTRGETRPFYRTGAGADVLLF